MKKTLYLTALFLISTNLLGIDIDIQTSFDAMVENYANSTNKDENLKKAILRTFPLTTKPDKPKPKRKLAKKTGFENYTKFELAVENENKGGADIKAATEDVNTLIKAGKNEGALKAIFGKKGETIDGVTLSTNGPGKAALTGLNMDVTFKAGTGNVTFS